MLIKPHVHILRSPAEERESSPVIVLPLLSERRLRLPGRSNSGRTGRLSLSLEITVLTRAILQQICNQHRFFAYKGYSIGPPPEAERRAVQ